MTRGRKLFELPYDWRRDNRVAARRLQRQSRAWLDAWRESSGAHDAKLVLVGHSMGGIISRYFLERLDGWRVVRARPERDVDAELVVLAEDVESGDERAKQALAACADGWHEAELGPLPEGVYRVTVLGQGAVEPVTELVTVLAE